MNLNIHRTLTLVCLMAHQLIHLPLMVGLQILSQIWTHLPIPQKHFFITNCSENVYKTTVKDKIDILEPLNIVT